MQTHQLYLCSRLKEALTGLFPKGQSQGLRRAIQTKMVKGTGSGAVGFRVIHHSLSLIKPFNFSRVIYSLTLSFLGKGVIIVTITNYGRKRLVGSMKSVVCGNVEPVS